MAAPKKRKKRKLSAAHLKALQAGLARWKRGAGKKTSRKHRPAKRTARRRRTTVTVTVRNPPKRPANRWWMFDTGKGCYVGAGTHDQAKKRAQAFANRTGTAGHLIGPFATRDAAKTACG